MPLTTPDGRYIIVLGKAGPRLWRAANPGLPEPRRSELIGQLMTARRAIKSNTSPEAVATARRQVDEAKRALGERGAVWWEDGAPDFNRRLIKNSPYFDWYKMRQAE